jgi:hypothetical protein
MLLQCITKRPVCQDARGFKVYLAGDDPFNGSERHPDRYQISPRKMKRT